MFFLIRCKITTKSSIMALFLYQILIDLLHHVKNTKKMEYLIDKKVKL